MKKLFWLAVCLGLALAVWNFWPIKVNDPKPTTQVEASFQQPKQNDNRIASLQKFFSLHHCKDYATDYIQAADRAGIDYRLLPSISVLESSCGLHTIPNSNNYWGWGSATRLQKFKTVQEGIWLITDQLGSGKYYQDKTVIQKLQSYNSVNPHYAQIIFGLMNQIK